MAIHVRIKELKVKMETDMKMHHHLKEALSVVQMDILAKFRVAQEDQATNNNN